MFLDFLCEILHSTKDFSMTEYKDSKFIGFGDQRTFKGSQIALRLKFVKLKSSVNC